MSGRSPIGIFALNAVFAIAYAVAGWLGLQLPYYGHYVTLIWTPTAIALVGAVFVGPAIAPGVFLGSFGLNLTIEPGVPVACALIAFGNTLAPLFSGRLLVRAYGFRPQLDRLRDGVAFLAIGVLGTGLVTATLGATWLCAFGAAPWADYPLVWFTWIAGETVGSLILAPLVFTWVSTPDSIVIVPAGLAESVAMIAVAVVFCAAFYLYGEQLVWLPYVFSLLFIWIIFRAGLRAASLAVAVVALALVATTALGSGPFMMEPPGAGLVSLWLSVAAGGTASVIAGSAVVERERALQIQKSLFAELDHRVKNTLATVVALADKSAEDAVGLEDFRERFMGRLQAIARTHEALARSSWRPMKVGDVVAETLAPFAGADLDRLQATGDGSIVPALKVPPLTMVLHELATNAAKHGAWSQRGGRVEVSWQRNGDGGLHLRWCESGGPSPRESAAGGYGLRLVRGVVDHQLGGSSEIDFGDDGLACTLRIPAD